MLNKLIPGAARAAWTGNSFIILIYRPEISK